MKTSADIAKSQEMNDGRLLETTRHRSDHLRCIRRDGAVHGRGGAEQEMNGGLIVVAMFLSLAATIAVCLGIGLVWRCRKRR